MDRNPEDPASWPRLFTVEEANGLLPELVPILEELRAKKAALDEARMALARLTPTMRSNGHGAEVVLLERRLRDLTAALAAGVRRIVGQGVEVKDLDHGLIDFPSPRDGRVVYLCWRLGEGAIAAWHEVDGGFAGRRPL
jgi:hypothetical protein